MKHAEALIEDQWAVIRQFLPANLDDHARQHGAMRRRRGQITSAEQLLRLLLMHIAGGLSLEQTVTRARVRGLADLNAMALHKRLCCCQNWMLALTSHALEGLRPFLDRPVDCWKVPWKVRILDATCISEPGTTGTDWRLHYSLRLPELYCDFFELTDIRGAESLRRLPVESGDLVLLDRGYNDREAVERVRKAGGHVILRYNSGAFPLVSKQGKPMDLLPRLRGLRVGRVRQWPVWFRVGNTLCPARLCALRKSAEAARRSQYRSGRKARCRGAKVRPETLELAHYLIVITSLPAASLRSEAVLEFYRARWQVELAFKRLKSLLELGQLPKKKEQSSRAWMQGKVLTALLIERVLCEARFFSPWGYPLAADQPLAPVQGGA